MTQPIPDDMTELVDADIDRVDIVGKAANGTRFIMAKSAGSPALFTPADVRHILKADGDAPEGDPAAVDLTEVLAEPTTDAPGDENQPGSPAWESTDAATACKWTAVLGRVKNALQVMADREGVESASPDGDWDDSENQWNLEDAADAVDYAISILAPFAVSEAQGAQLGAEAAAALIGKAVDEMAPNLGTVEGLGVIRKAGRALSAANETALRNAAEAIQKVLASLPAPEETPVEKEAATLADTETPAVEPAAVVAAETPVVKADEEAASGLVAVFDQKGNLVGVTDPANIQAVSGASGEAPAEPAPAAAAAPAADAGAAQAASDLTKGAEPDALTKAIEAAVAPLLKRIDDLEHTPVPTGALLAGRHPGTAGESLGEGRDREDLVKQVREAVDPGDKMLGIAELIKRGRTGE